MWLEKILFYFMRLKYNAYIIKCNSVRIVEICVVVFYEAIDGEKI